MNDINTMSDIDKSRTLDAISLIAELTNSKGRYMEALRSLRDYLSSSNGRVGDWVIYDALFQRSLMMHSKKEKKETEVDGIHKRFVKSHMELLPDSEIVQVKIVSGLRPDFFIKLDGNIYPVELKRVNATQKSVRQVQEYINHFKSNKGFLVCPGIGPKTVLPDNVIHITLH